MFGCNIVYRHELCLVATSFIAMNYFWLQHRLLPRKIRVVIEAITTPLVVVTNDYVSGKKGLSLGQWSWQQMTTSVATETIATLHLSLHLMSNAMANLVAITTPIATTHNTWPQPFGTMT